VTPSSASSASEGSDDSCTVAEDWFRHHGLPWFVEHEDARIAAVLRPSRAIPVMALAIAISGTLAVVTWAAERAAADETFARPISAGLVVGASAFGALAALYAIVFLRAGSIVRWAARRAVSDLSLVLPLITRALPLLLLFNTFLFINTEVWQVASALERSDLLGIVLVFSGVAVAFLLAQLPLELSKVMDDVAGGGVDKACAGTPLEGLARGGTPAGGDLTLSPRQRANLLLVLLIAQAVQVLLLALAVFAFFVLFGLVAIGDDVVTAWVGAPPHLLEWTHIAWFDVRIALPLSNELFQVSVFLAGFSGLYFTVYAVSDPTYREQFFTRISRDLEQAVGVRAVYQGLLAGGLGAPD
jgi:hypothetical protein